MRRNHHLKEMIESIKKTEEVIFIHKGHDCLGIIIDQYEALKAKQVAELIDELAMPPFQSIQSLSLIKQIINKFYPLIDTDIVEQKELKELAMSI